MSNTKADRAFLLVVGAAVGAYVTHSYSRRVWDRNRPKIIIEDTSILETAE